MLGDFYSRPCGRGDLVMREINAITEISTHAPAGGATSISTAALAVSSISTHAPAGGATQPALQLLLSGLQISTHAPAGGATLRRRTNRARILFLLTPLREGRPAYVPVPPVSRLYFYSRPCGRGDQHRPHQRGLGTDISTHAPAGGATAIFHKSVMRFCGKLPKDDTVLCLASFGFPRRDPKAVYLAWISCANLPQKCVRQGLALKDQGTSCFHEGLASHAFDPVLV